MTRSRRLSAQATAVVLALAEDPAAWRYGYELCQTLGLKAGSMYPILMRLADRGLLETAWERDPPAGRPPRHLYRLTGPGPRPGRRAPRPGGAGGPARDEPGPPAPELGGSVTSPRS